LCFTDADFLTARSSYECGVRGDGPVRGTEAGVFVAAARLKNSTGAKRIVFEGTRRTVVDGPFAESRELVARLLGRDAPSD
jgi:hypothetical protein